MKNKQTISFSLACENLIVAFYAIASKSILQGFLCANFPHPVPGFGVSPHCRKLSRSSFSDANNLALTSDQPSGAYVSTQA
ncbi:MAG: hypothetical protein V7K48_05605 [Nostoc sp.]|uniref:hypothetical protein n=1 Tax=Nostoc sp. TaxID=1180 RepID=UPI002FF578BD